ncbi:MAG: SgcJ/EcaC family oxidoreductase [Acidimicrobiales bacterium]
MPTPDQIRATVEDYVVRWNAGNAEAMGELFATDGSVADPVDQPAHHGREAIAAFFEGTFTSGMDATLSITGPIRVAGHHAAFPMQVAVDLGEQTGRLDIIDTMEFDDSGLIQVMRAFWDAAAMEIS